MEDTFLKQNIKLIHLGGFVKECIEEEIAEVYEADTLEQVIDVYPIGKKFIEIMDATEDVKKTMHKYPCCYKKCEENPYARDVFNDQFNEWVIEQVIKMYANDVNSENNRCMLQIPISLKKKTSKFNVLDKRVFFLSNRLNKDKKQLSAEEIAKLPEFNCEVEYIETILKFIDEILKYDNGMKITKMNIYRGKRG